VLVELDLLEQRHKAVLEVLNGATVMDVACRSGAAYQTLHDCLRHYEKHGSPGSPTEKLQAPHLPPPDATQGWMEARVCAIRRERPGWDPERLRYELRRRRSPPGPQPFRGVPGIGTPTSCSSPPTAGGANSDYRRWERSRAMELWQMDVVGGVKLEDGTEPPSSPASTTIAGFRTRPRSSPLPPPSRCACFARPALVNGAEGVVAGPRQAHCGRLRRRFGRSHPAIPRL
jgi:hypothetical protein